MHKLENLVIVTLKTKLLKCLLFEHLISVNVHNFVLVHISLGQLSVQLTGYTT